MLRVSSVKRRLRRGSTFWSQNVQNSACSEHFLKLRCGKIARRCGEKHVFNQNAPLATCSDHFLKLRCGKILATFSIKMCLSLHVRTTFWSCDAEKLHAAVARSTFSIKMRFSLHVRTTFWSCDAEKLHAAVARSTFWSENIQNTACSDHFLKLRCRKIARRCSEKHICKSKCQKTDGYGPLFDVQMWKNGTPL